jgi:hypothetical protein
MRDCVVWLTAATLDCCSTAFPCIHKTLPSPAAAAHNSGLVLPSDHNALGHHLLARYRTAVPDALLSFFPCVAVYRAAISVAILPMSEQYGWSDTTKGAINR